MHNWWAVRDSNPRQSVCKTDTLPTELTARAFFLEEAAPAVKRRQAQALPAKGGEAFLAVFFRQFEAFFGIEPGFGRKVASHVG